MNNQNGNLSGYSSLLVSALLLACHVCPAQTEKLQALEKRLMSGDKTALFEIAPYFDSKKKVVEFLGYHRLEPMESEIAKRIVNENCLFTAQEITIDESTTSSTFRNFVQQEESKILFSDLAGAFLITPLGKRDVEFQLRSLSKAKVDALKSAAKDLLNLDWVKYKQIDFFIVAENPKALLEIASDLFQTRNRFDRYQFNTKEYLDLLQYLTGVEIGVKDELNQMSWHIDSDFERDSRLNLLIYFAKYYSEYSWDAKRSLFVNPNHRIAPIRAEENLFQLLASKNDAVAMDAFSQLTTSDTAIVKQLADEYEKAGVDKNFSLPTFPYRFLKQLVVYTDYCRSNKIDYKGSAGLHNNIEALKSSLSFEERYQLENRLIDDLTFADVGAFEYWSLVYSSNWNLTYSAGRILDKFYSKNWNQMLTDREKVCFYLKKMTLFGRLGIIGVCNNYYKKFAGYSSPILEDLKAYPPKDPEIRNSLQKISLLKAEQNTQRIPFRGESNNDFAIASPTKDFLKIISSKKSTDDKEYAIIELLSRISYAQIPEALKMIETYSFTQPYHAKYAFIESDFGIFLPGDLDDKEVRREFVRLHSEVPEYQFYAHYLDNRGIDYKLPGGSLDYEKIYEMLKYDVVTAFAGGGGTKKGNHIYSLIKLLELTFKTTLGYPAKLCNSKDIYACYPDERALAWMDYLNQKGLLKSKHNQPVSFTID